MKLPVITLVAAATMLSCSQSQKQANAASDTGTDTLSSSVLSADSLTGANRHFVNGYVFIYNVLCESQDKKIHEHVSEDSFCFDNYEFPITDCISFLRDSNDVLYYCPPVQDDISLSVFMTKEQF